MGHSKTRKWKKHGGANNNNNNKNNHNNNNNNNNENNFNNDYYGYNLNIVNKMREGDVEWFRQQLDSGQLLIDKTYSIYWSFNEDPELHKQFKGSLLSYLAGINSVNSDALKRLDIGIPQHNLTKLLKFFLKYHPNPNFELEEDSAWDPFGENLDATKPLAFLLAEDDEENAMILLKYILENYNFTEKDAEEYLDSMMYVLREKNFHEQSQEDLDLYDKWFPILNQLAHKQKMKNAFKNIKIAPSTNTRRKKRNLQEEIKLLPPIPEMRFPGGNDYRKALEEFESIKNTRV